MIDLDGALRLADSAPHVVLELVRTRSRSDEVLDAVGVADGCLEAGPVERQPVGQRGREAHAEEVERRQLLDQLAEQPLLGLEAPRVLALAGGASHGPSVWVRRRLDDRRTPEPLAAHVGQPGDDLVAAADHRLAP